MSSATHAKKVEDALLKSGIPSTKKTHIMRGAGARLAEMAGVDSHDIARLGQWTSSAVDRYYLSQLPWKTMRIMAGFSAEYNDCDIAEMPCNLQQIFLRKSFLGRMNAFCDLAWNLPTDLLNHAPYLPQDF